MDKTARTELAKKLRYDRMKATMIDKFGSVEAWKSWMRTNARKGGENTSNRPFRDKPGLASKAGKISAIKRKHK